MEMWRWVQNCPAVHLVSRRISTSMPGFPNGLMLHDVAITRSRLRGRSEDVLFAEDPMLLRRLRRGLSFVESVGTGGEATLVRRGLPKFFDMDAQTLSAVYSGEDAGEPLSSAGSLSEKVCGSLLGSVRDAISGGSFVELSRLDKANGENAQVSFFTGTGQWVLCSKNVSMLAANAAEIELPQWSDRRYRFARHVAELWFAQLMALTDTSRKHLEETLSSRTLVGEMIGGSGAHLVDYGSLRRLQWFAVVPNQGDELCWPPASSLAFFHQMGLPAVSLKLLGPDACTSLEDAVRALQESCLATEKATLQDVGEGFVTYVTARSQDDDKGRVIHLSKMKSMDYRLLRRMRERAKVFAQRAGSMLVEDVVEEYRKEVVSAGLDPNLTTCRTETLAKLCRMIFAEDISSEAVDEQFLQLLHRAESFEGKLAPGRAAPVLCVIAPPGEMTTTTWNCLEELFRGEEGSSDAKSVRFPDSLQKGNLSSAWHDSTASRKRAFLNVSPQGLESLFFPAKAGEEAPRKRRRVQEALEEKQQQVATRLASSFRSRCQFLFWGWSDALLPEHAKQTADLARPCRTRFESRMFARLKPRRRQILGKLQSHALRLWIKLPESQARWLPTLPRLTETRALSTMVGSFGAPTPKKDFSSPGPGQNSARPVTQSTVIVVIPLGLPGMGKSSLLEHLFQLGQRSAWKAYRQGQLVQTEKGGEALHSVATLSSDEFTGEELRCLGMDAASSSSKDVVRCRKMAASRYQGAIEEFFEQAAAAATDSEKLHLLLLDKNHPPSALHREAQTLQALAARVGCHVCLKALAIVADSEATALPSNLLQEEEKHFGPWAYPWSPGVLAECASRLLLRASHETLSGNETSLFVLLGFLRLHHRLAQLSDLADSSIEVVHAPYISIGGLASWQGHDAPDPWHQLELRALFHQALLVMQKPFANQEPVQPLLSAISRLLLASGLRSPGAESQAQHARECAEGLWPNILRPRAIQESALPDVVPPVRYVALEVEQHHVTMEALLRRLSDAMRIVAGDCEEAEAFHSQLFSWPQVLHITTCYVGGGTLPASERDILTKSKHLFREAAEFDCAVTHLVGARGALALAVVDEPRLRADGLPIADAQRPHITLCTRSPWQPRHSNDVLKAAKPFLGEDAGVAASGKWMRNLAVGSAVLDVFVLKLENPVLLASNAVKLC